MEQIAAVKEILKSAQWIVFFGGAGVSTGSGIPDFRSNDGIYGAEESKEYYLSNACLRNDPEVFFRFYREHMLYPDAQPNTVHLALAKMEQQGKLRAVITQNIDGLHQKAGSKRVIELHGTANRYYCRHCGKVYDSDILLSGGNIPYCAACGAVVRPDVTLYGEALDGYNYADAEAEISQADVLIVGGSSLVVHPAASLIDAFTGEHLIIINYSPTAYDGLAECIIHDSISDVLRYLAEE